MNLIKSLKAWRIRSQQRSLERWEQVRAKGRVRFVLRQGLIFPVVMIAMQDVAANIFYDGGQISNLWFNLVQYFLIGIFAGYMGWSDREGKYMNACLNRRLQTPFDDRIMPR